MQTMCEAEEEKRIYRVPIVRKCGSLHSHNPMGLHSLLDGHLNFKVIKYKISHFTHPVEISHLLHVST
jgi:hypothetical protein